MMPDFRLREERGRKRARVAAFIALSSVVVGTVLLQPGYQWVSLVIGVCGAVAVVASGNLLGVRTRGDLGKEGREKRGRVGALIGCGAIVVSGLFQPGWQWVPCAVGVSVAVAVAASADLAGRRAKGSGHGRGSVLGVRGRDDDAPAGVAVRQWRMLVMVSRLMPRSAGLRWLAEAESLLSEIGPARRGAAIRSYLLSAPALMAMMWAHMVKQRARLGPRHPG